MEVTKKDIDKLNALLTVNIVKDDYQTQVDAVLNKYRKTANIPGFRKGFVPMSLVKKQYGKAVLVEEVNKILQKSVHEYLTQEKLEVLGNPLPKNNDINWESEDFAFEFELGLAPEFKVDLKKKAIPHYKIVADDKTISNQISHLQKQYGKLISKTEVGNDDEITGTFQSEEAEIDKETTFELADIKGKKQLNALIGAKPGDTLSIKSKGLFKEDAQYARYLGVSLDAVKTLDTTLTLQIKEVNFREKAALDQNFFDTLFGKDTVKTEAEMKARLKADFEAQMVQQSDQKLLNDVVETLIAQTSFDLPETFLKKWIQHSGEETLTEIAAAEEYTRTEKGLRYQLIEGKLREAHELNATFEELKAHAEQIIKQQMAQFGQTQPTDEEVQQVVARIMSNQDEVKRLSEQVQTQKMLNFYKENAKIKVKEVTYDKFLKEAYAA